MFRFWVCILLCFWYRTHLKLHYTSFFVISIFAEIQISLSKRKVQIRWQDSKEKASVLKALQIQVGFPWSLWELITALMLEKHWLLTTKLCLLSCSQKSLTSFSEELSRNLFVGVAQQNTNWFKQRRSGSVTAPFIGIWHTSEFSFCVLVLFWFFFLLL